MLRTRTGDWRNSTILAAILSHVEQRQVESNYTFPLNAKTYRIVSQDICAGLRGAYIRVEQRRDGSVVARFQDRYLRIERCDDRPKVTPRQPVKARALNQPGKPSEWSKGFDLKKGPKVWQAAQATGARFKQPL